MQSRLPAHDRASSIRPLGREEDLQAQALDGFDRMEAWRDETLHFKRSLGPA